MGHWVVWPSGELEGVVLRVEDCATLLWVDETCAEMQGLEGCWQGSLRQVSALEAGPDAPVSATHSAD